MDLTELTRSEMVSLFVFIGTLIYAWASLKGDVNHFKADIKQVKDEAKENQAEIKDSLSEIKLHLNTLDDRQHDLAIKK